MLFAEYCIGQNHGIWFILLEQETVFASPLYDADHEFECSELACLTNSSYSTVEDLVNIRNFASNDIF